MCSGDRSRETGIAAAATRAVCYPGSRPLVALASPPPHAFSAFVVSDRLSAARRPVGQPRTGEARLPDRLHGGGIRRPSRQDLRRDRHAGDRRRARRQRRARLQRIPPIERFLLPVRPRVGACVPAAERAVTHGHAVSPASRRGTGALRGKDSFGGGFGPRGTTHRRHAGEGTGESCPRSRERRSHSPAGVGAVHAPQPYGDRQRQSRRTVGGSGARGQ